jgi:2-iminobutanoate/2-iminopropanoate deaminase
MKMARTAIAPPGMKDQRPRYTLGWRVGQTIYVAGQLPYDGEGNLVGIGDIKAQTRRVFENVRKIVEAGGGTMDDVVKLTVFVTDVRFREAYGEVRTEFFGPNPPASTLVQISNLAVPGALIEIEAVAALDA